MPEDNIINKVFSLLGKENGPVSDKDMLLKQTIRDLSQNKYAKFYRPKPEEVDPSFAQYVYTIYKTIYPVQVFIIDMEKSGNLNSSVIEYFMPPKALEIARRLSPEAIEIRSKTTAPGLLAKQLEEDYQSLTTIFDLDRAGAADKCYNLLIALSYFVKFDFAGFLKKFDSAMLEGIFTTPLKFAPIRGDMLVEELGAFYTAISVLNPQDDWKTAFSVLRAIKGGTDSIPYEQWAVLLANLSDLRSSKIIELIVRHATKNPIWDGKEKVPSEHLSSVWFDEKREDVRGRINAIAESQRNSQMEALLRAIFGEIDTTRLSYYNERTNQVYRGKDLDGFVYAATLNYLAAFLQDFFSKEMQEICDIILIRGQWSSNTGSLQMSEGFHGALEALPAIEALDATLSEKGSNGPRLRGALLRVDRDRTQIRYIASIIDGIDEEALEIIKTAGAHIITVGKHIKALSDDIPKKQGELIINWKELDAYSKIPLAQRILDAYKKINYFVQLITLATRPLEGS
ncbi:MAG: DUF5312 domain-containing protein [Treponema sp.]|jgi:hypothetical protein|nr:DUF5312 domain-containing protein [Treponema sp.]